MSGSLKAMRGGTPSTTTPIAGPWLSPQVVKRNSVPKLLPAIAASRGPNALNIGRCDGLSQAEPVFPAGATGLTAGRAFPIVRPASAGDGGERLSWAALPHHERRR